MGDLGRQSGNLNLVRSYSVENITKLMVNNERYSDIKFIVENEIIYSNKSFLALNSPVFESMFFGELKHETNEPIKITDCSRKGFLNMIKFIYGYKIDEICFSDIHETYMASDKYLVYHLIEELFDYIRRNVNPMNCCEIYDQLIKIKADTKDENLEQRILDQLRKMIQLKSDAIFLSNHFSNICIETLTDLLKMKTLNINEIDVLKSCCSWVSSEMKRRKLISNTENKRAIFETIKSLIRFTDLETDELKDFDEELDEYLSTEELNSLLLHLIKKSRPLIIKYNSPREKNNLLEYCFSEYNLVKYGRCDTLISTKISVQKKVSIQSIDTFLSNQIIFLELMIFRNDEKLDLKIENEIVNKKWSFKFCDKKFELEPTFIYRLDFVFRFYHFDDSNKLSNEFEMEFNNYRSFGMKLIRTNYNLSVHCIKRIVFNN